ncbi:uncharacterized protein C8R40DRAFT_630155 [Lentinula edodes]|uniref:uncharacterized protein n=1 Tax=Lentinula edodes TaxID=5353 RepID=UPI001E8DB473|nr:uncharacterized protein C8R40DRAFT_630155 [Lentinula edodes]KAH7870842.1 hypothetical protein C8R40DRAFT_630155 [Lentinula edodes]
MFSTSDLLQFCLCGLLASLHTEINLDWYKRATAVCWLLLPSLSRTISSESTHKGIWRLRNPFALVSFKFCTCTKHGSINKMLSEKLDVTIVSSRQAYAKHYLVDHLVIYPPRRLQPYFAIYQFLFATTYFCHYLTSRPSYFSWLWCEQSTKLFWLAIHGGSGHDVLTPSATPRIFKASSFRSEETCPFIRR